MAGMLFVAGNAGYAEVVTQQHARWLAAYRINGKTALAARSMTEACAPRVALVKADSAGCELEIATYGFSAADAVAKQATYTAIGLPGCGPTEDIGAPQLPVIRRMLVAPLGARVVASVTGDSEQMAGRNIGVVDPVFPRQQPVAKLPGALEAAPLDINRTAYAADAFSPASPVRVVEAGMVAGRRLVLLEIMPLACNPARQEFKLFTTLDVRVQFEGGTAAALPLTLHEDRLLATIALNHTPTLQAFPAKRLLVIAHDALAPGLAAFAAHKTSMGLLVAVTNTSAIGATTNAIRNFIVNQYTNLPTRPSAVLLVGDTDLVPCFIGGGSNHPASDLYYACTDTNDDWQPEFPVGRFSVTNLIQLAAVVAKTIAYETNAPAAWMGRAVFISGNDFYTITEGGHNEVITNYMVPRGYTSDRLYSHTYAANAAQVTAAFNDGRVFGIFSGHGSETSWADGPPFSQANVNALVNTNMFPFVCSFACLTGNMLWDECFAETWQRGANNAAVITWASSVNSYWDQDNILEPRLFAAMFDHDRRVFGDAILLAKYLYLLYFGASDPMTRQYFEQYNLFGDPTVTLVEPSLSIVAPSPLPLCYTNEYYQQTLAAIGGTRPYTNWVVSAGTLPAGLSLNPTNGLIAGTATAIVQASMTVMLTDAAGATTSKVVDYVVVARLRAVPGLDWPGPTNLPDAQVHVPYRTTLHAQGGTAPYTWSVLSRDDFDERNPGSGWRGTGVAQGWHAEKQTWPLSLPWPFPFYGSMRTSLWVCNNGYIDFASDIPQSDNSVENLAANQRIAPFWQCLLTTTNGEDIFVDSHATADYVLVRWQAHTYDSNFSNVPVNVELMLFRDGRIQFNYSNALADVLPIIGVSKGDFSQYTLSTWNAATVMPAFVSTLFVPGALLPAGLMLTNGNEIAGTPTEPGTFTIITAVADAGPPRQSVTNALVLNVIPEPLIPLLAVWCAALCLRVARRENTGFRR